jgi:hypothetical protein
MSLITYPNRDFGRASQQDKPDAQSMTAAEFRTLALSFPGAAEASHMGHADFRVRGRIFATLGYPDEGWGMVKIGSDKQAELIRSASEVFSRAKGAWGLRGSTLIKLKTADRTMVKEALAAACKRII